MTLAIYQVVVSHIVICSCALLHSLSLSYRVIILQELAGCSGKFREISGTERNVMLIEEVCSRNEIQTP